MQQFTPYFPGYDASQQQTQQTQQPQQSQNGQNQPQDQQQQQQQPPMPLNGANLAIYNPAAMQPLAVMAPNPAKPTDQQQSTTDAMDLGAHGKPKRKQVKNACVNCQKACKKCDVGRPCQRCIKYGLTETCINSVRKERKKGVKRGPYKKRNKTGENAATGVSNMAPPITNANLYGQNPNVRPPAMPIHYPFPPGHYDPYAYAAAAAAAASNGQMMPQAYMVPAAIQQMYPANPPVLAYQAAINMMAPQQQTPATQGGFRPVPIQPQPSPDVKVNATTANATTANTTNSNEATTTSTPIEAAPIATEAAASSKTDDDDDEGSKLNILSKLCSEVLESSDAPKQDCASNTEAIKTEEANQNITPASGTHSREISQDNTNNNNTADATGTDASQTIVHTQSAPSDAIGARSTSTPTNTVYGAPGTSPSDPPAVDAKAQAPSSEQQPQEQKQQ